MDKDLLKMVDDLRDLLKRMNAYQLTERDGAMTVASTAYGHVWHGMHAILHVLTNGGDTDHLNDYLLDNPDENTEWCIAKWREDAAPGVDDDE